MGTIEDIHTPDDIAHVIESGAVHSVYQPIVDLQTLDVVAYEALARGPSGSALATPGALFAAAEREDLVAELDRACRAAAIGGAAARSGGQLTVFVNVEPGALGGGPVLLPEHLRLIRAGGLHVVMEVTERALTNRPRDLLAAVERLRGTGAGIALDDVGADQRSLALMPFLHPDVVKLDMTLVQERPSQAIASIANAVSAYAESSGAAVLAEGIEDQDHLRRAVAMGARFGQGWMFGKPHELPIVPPTRPEGLGLEPVAPREVPAATPYECVSAHRPPMLGNKLILLERSLQLEEQAAALGPEGVLLATFQDHRFFTPITARRYQRLAESMAFVGAFGSGMPPNPAGAVRGATIDEAEMLHGEWNVIVIGPHFAGAFVARDVGDTGADGDRRFDFCMTYERDLVIDAASTLMQRVVPTEPRC